MNARGGRAYGVSGRRMLLVAAALLALATGTAVALVASTEEAGATGQGFPGCSGTLATLQGSSGSVTVDGLTLTFTPTGQGTASFVVTGGTFTGQIFVKGGPVHSTQSFTNATGGTVTAATNPANNKPYGISHIDVCLQEDGNGTTTGTTGTTTTGTTETETTETETTETETTPTTPGGDGGVPPGDGEVTTTPGGEVVQETTTPSGEVVTQEVAPGAQAPGQLAFTGFSTVPLALLAGAMLLLGVGLRRRT